MKRKKEYIIKIPIVITYLLPFIISFFKNEKLSFSGIYYIGLILAFVSLVKFKDEIVNNWLFALSIILFLINLILVCMYFF